MDFSVVNIWAVLACGVAGLVLGSIWYSPLTFGKIWQREAYMTPEKMKSANMGLIFGLTFALTVIMALNLDLFFGTEVGFTDGLLYGFFTGLFWVGFSLGILYLFEKHSLKLWGINAGYLTLLFTVMGGILGAWQ